MVKRLIGRVRGSESGFTLIEMLIVVGIIVALAAAIVPQVVSFSGKGEEGQKTSEKATVAAAIEGMLADVGITSVAQTPGTANLAWGAAAIFGSVQPATRTAVPLYPTYLSIQTTTYAYCFNSKGAITKQEDTAGGAC